ncbi:hypothetical protein QUW17_15145 [Bacteroides gallinaceum]|nr:hypothetical protein [Bacteroides gallinaceum]MDM8209182.1 hypothetical protein [Bacteroides gallinaceum]
MKPHKWRTKRENLMAKGDGRNRFRRMPVHFGPDFFHFVQKAFGVVSALR